MRDIFKKAVNLVLSDDSSPLLRLRKKDRPLKHLTERELIQLESEIGVQIFGEIPAHVKRREFFNLDENTWIWYEEVAGKDGKLHKLTTKYEIQPHGVLKVQPNYQYSYLEGDELDNFVLAVKEYYERVAREIYKRDPESGKPLPETKQTQPTKKSKK